ncbi:hypothetical protein BpHYR1_026023 [Brachionus plicatilis]|uniref:Uncharacterized protein n=1 Tax=Brachionus plicatilis TaxID=10195 RepID=A0A3M7PND8_BRAPC|nr:hypothetical protein BpHYR1_026023 [Brachionus plicatilis]
MLIHRKTEQKYFPWRKLFPAASKLRITEQLNILNYMFCHINFTGMICGMTSCLDLLDPKFGQLE